MRRFMLIKKIIFHQQQCTEFFFIYFLFIYLFILKYEYTQTRKVYEQTYQYLTVSQKKGTINLILDKENTYIYIYCQLVAETLEPILSKTDPRLRSDSGKIGLSDPMDDLNSMYLKKIEIRLIFYRWREW